MSALDLRPIAELVHGDVTLPDEVRRTGSILLLDTLGALAGGLRYPAVRRLAATLGTGGAATVPHGRTVVLGTAATWLDADSGGSFHPAGARLPPVPTAHPAPHVLPILLHEAAKHGVNDEDLLRAFVLACEVGLRFGVGTTLRPGLHPHGIHGPVAAAVAASLLHGRDRTTTVRAIELAAAMPLAATLAVPMTGGTVRNVWTGLGAWYGASASVWAAAGLPSSAAVLDDVYRTSVCTDLSVEEITGGLGRRWRMLDSYLKPYACARWVHPALDALHHAAERLPGGWPAVEDVVGIDVATFAYAASLDGTVPTSDLHARFSVPLSLSALLHDGHLHAGSYLPDRLARPSLLRVARLVRLREEAAYSAALPRERPCRVTLRLRDGQQATAEVRGARGNPDDPLSTAEVVDKFRHNVGDLLPPPQRHAVATALTGPGTTGSGALTAASRLLLASLADVEHNPEPPQNERFTVS